MIKTGELEKVMQMFERTDQFYQGGRYVREDRSAWPKQRYYHHGQTNEYFKAYLFGYSFGRCVERTEGS